MFLDFFLLGLEAKRPHGHLQLLGVYFTRSIGVEQVESLFDFLLLFFEEGLGYATGASLRATK